MAYYCIITNAKGVIFMSFKNKLRIKQQRRSDKRRKERKRLKKLRIKKANERKNLKNSELYTFKKPDLPEKVIVEEVVKNGAIEGTLNVKFDKRTYSINVRDASLKKMVYSVDTGRERCAMLEEFSKIILLNRERTTPILASAI